MSRQGILNCLESGGPVLISAFGSRLVVPVVSSLFSCTSSSDDDDNSNSIQHLIW